MGLESESKVEFLTEDGHTVVMAPVEPRCILCGSVDDLIEDKRHKCHFCVDCYVDVTGKDELRK